MGFKRQRTDTIAQRRTTLQTPARTSSSKLLQHVDLHREHPWECVSTPRASGRVMLMYGL